MTPIFHTTNPKTESTDVGNPEETQDKFSQLKLDDPYVLNRMYQLRLLTEQNFFKASTGVIRTFSNTNFQK